MQVGSAIVGISEPGDEAIHRRIDAVEERLRVDAHDHNRDQQGSQVGHLAGVEVFQGDVGLVLERAEHHALEAPEHVGRAEDDAADGDHRGDRGVLERAEQHHELSDEPVQAGKADGAEAHHHEHKRKLGDGLGETTVLGDHPGVTALVEHAHQEEQRAGADAVAEHLVDRPAHAGGVEREQAQHTVPKMADRAVGDELLDVVLNHRDQRAIDDADDREPDQQGPVVDHRLREQRHRKPVEPVGSHLQHHARQHHRAAGGRLDVGVRKPGVEGEHRDLDREGERETREHPQLGGVRDLQREQRLEIGGPVPRGLEVQVVQRDERDQHQQGADDGVDEELHRRVDATLPAPNADEEVHRDEHELPEHVEQEGVQRDEGADHRPFEGQHQREVAPMALFDAREACEDDDRRERGGQQHQQQADAVNSHVVVHAERVDPRHVLNELERRSRRGVVKAEPQRERRCERHQGHAQRRHLGRRPWHHRHKHRPDDGQEGNERKHD